MIPHNRIMNETWKSRRRRRFLAAVLVVGTSSSSSLSSSTVATRFYSVSSFSVSPPFSRSPRRRRRNGSFGPLFQMVATSLVDIEYTDTITSQTNQTIPDITMDDVVESAKRVLGRPENVDDDENDRETSPRTDTPIRKTHVEWFQEHNDDRIAESERIAFDRLVMDDDCTDDSTRTTIDRDMIVNWNDLKSLLAAGIITSQNRIEDHDHNNQHNLPVTEHNHDVEATIRLYERMKSSGGYLVVELDENDAEIVRAMWKAMEDYFSMPTDQLDVDRQILKRDDGSEDPQGGYRFSRTYLNADGIVLPETIQDTLKNTREARIGIEGSCQLFAEICKTVGTIAAAGALETDLGTMNAVVSSLLDERSGHPFVNAEHRLCQYITSSTSQDDPTPATSAKESLISHTDWTFTTCIPLSATPGLQLWKPDTKEWIVPEELILDAIQTTEGSSKKDRTNYVVVMAGNWIELLTNQRLLSCVHRVVTQQSPSQARLSAPFFCRTKKYILQMVLDRFDKTMKDGSSSSGGSSSRSGRNIMDDDNDVVSFTTNQRDAIHEICEVFQDLIRFTKGDRDPDIPSCVLDICLYKDGDYVPSCYSIDRVLGD